MPSEQPNEAAERPTVNGIVIGPRIIELMQGEGVEAEMFHACVYGDSQRVCDLLIADPGLVHLSRGVFWSAQLACQFGQCDVLRVLLDHGASPNGPGLVGTLLHTAAHNGHVASVALLIQRGADVNAVFAYVEPAKITPLLQNVFRPNGGEEEIVRMLLQGGADPEIRTGSWSALSHAAGAGNLAVVKVLLEFGADVNTKTGDFSSWDTPDSRNWPIVEPDWRNTRPLYGAVCTGSRELVELLLDHGADINALSFGWTALHAAAGQGNAEMVKLLLARGADVSVKSSNQMTAIDLLRGHKRSAKLLREAVERRQTG